MGFGPIRRNFTLSSLSLTCCLSAMSFYNNIYKFAVPTSIPLRFISVMGFALYVRRNLCVSVQAHTQSSAVHARLIAFMHTGSHLLSRAVSSKVPSAAWVLTIVFGMGTGVTPRRIATGKIQLSEVLSPFVDRTTFHTKFSLRLH